MADDLPHEEGVALGLLVDGADQGPFLLVQVMAGGLFHHGQHLALVEAGEGEALHRLVPAQVGQQLDEGVAGPELGVAVGGQHEEPQGRRRTDDVAEQEEGRLGGPLQVVEDEQDGLVGGDGAQPGGHGVEEAVALGLGVGTQRGVRAPGPAPEARGPDGPARRRSDPGEEPGGSRACGRPGGGGPRPRAGRGRPGPRRSARPAPSPRRRGARGQDGRQAGLAHPWLAPQHRHPPLARPRLLPGDPQAVELVLPAHEDAPRAGEEGGQGDRGKLARLASLGFGVLGPLPAHRHGRDRGGQPFEGERAEGPEAEVAPGADQGGHELTGQDLAPLGPVAETLGHHHGRPEEVVLGPHRLPGVESHPHAEATLGMGPVVFGRCPAAWPGRSPERPGGWRRPP